MEMMKINRGTNLSAPLAFQASLGGDFAVAAVHQGLQAVDLVFVVDIDSEVEVVSEASTGPGELTSAMVEGQGALSLRFADQICREGGVAGEELGVENAGEKEGHNDQEEGPDVMGAGAEKLVVRT